MLSTIMQNTTLTPEDLAKAAEHVRVVKRNGEEVEFNLSKIANAVRKCLVNDVGMLNGEAATVAAAIAEKVEIFLLQRAAKHSGRLSVEAIQDAVEITLTTQGYHQASRSYVLYREEHARLRKERPIPPEIQQAFDEAEKLFTGLNPQAQLLQAYDKFARFLPEKGRRETWTETVCDRVMPFFKNHVNEFCPGAITDAEWDELEYGLLHLEATPSMRCIQMAGPALERCHVGVYNCAFQVLDSPRAMAEELYVLMQGTGGGFSVEESYAVDAWPRVKKIKKNAEVAHIVVQDTTEAWCDSVRDAVEIWLDGRDVTFDYSPIRPAGALLKTKGGRASGPGPLMELHAFLRKTIQDRAGRRLRSIDLHDMACMIHRIVQMGGVRRASGISLSDLDDKDMRHAKDGAFWNTHDHRKQANNSAVYEEKPTAVDFMEEWLSLAKSGSGERGIFNRGSLRKQLPKRRKHTYFGTNPCGEIILRSHQFCNLSIGVVRKGMTFEEIKRRVRLAAIWGTIQSTMTKFNYLHDDWKKNSEEERLLGVDILGHLDCELLQPGLKGSVGNRQGREARLRELLQLVNDTNAEFADRFGIPHSAATTCGKPSGDSSVFLDAAPGLKAYHSQFYLRRFRLDSSNPIAQLLKDEGVPWNYDVGSDKKMVFDFPMRAPEGAILFENITAIDQLENWLTFKKNFTEHNPSVTISVREEEWFDVGQWVYKNWDDVGGLSFLPYYGGVYPLAPYEAITAEKYEELAAKFPRIDWAKLTRYETEDMTTLSQQYACSAGGCEIG